MVMPMSSHTSGCVGSVSGMSRLFHCRGGAHELPLILPPAAEHRQCIEQSTVICPAAAMLLEKPGDFLRIQEARIGGAGRCPCFIGEVAEAADEPVGERHLETELAPGRSLPGQPGLDRSAKHIFADAAAQ